jgi:hypothetical protein
VIEKSRQSCGITGSTSVRNSTKFNDENYAQKKSLYRSRMRDRMGRIISDKGKYDGFQDYASSSIWADS